MNTALNLNVVHESEAQRQHARVKLPGKIRFPGANRESLEQNLLDISAGGFSFVSGKPVTQLGAYHHGTLLFQLDSLSLAMDVEFQVRNLDPESGRTGCQFHNLGAREIATLRQLITSHLSGELVTVGDVICTLQRDNFTKARKPKGLAQQTPFERLRAVGLSLAIFIAGLGAFGLILKQLYNLYFVTHAESGMVSVPAMQVTMPREGTVQSLVGTDGLVAKGAPIAAFSASMLEMLRGHLDEEQLDPANVEKLFARQMQGTLTSPCDCKVIAQRVADGQFATKGEVIFELLPRDAMATVDARFPYRDFAKVGPGTPISFTVPGEEEPRHGRIVDSALESGEIQVTIQPERPLDSTLAGQPVEVTIDRGLSYERLIGKLMSAGR